MSGYRGLVIVLPIESPDQACSLGPKLDRVPGTDPPHLGSSQLATQVGMGLGGGGQIALFQPKLGTQGIKNSTRAWCCSPQPVTVLAVPDQIPFGV